MSHPTSLQVRFPRGLRQAPGAALAAFLLVLGGCETVQIGGDTTNPGDTTAAEATLLLVNQRQQDPGPLTFLLYLPATQDIESVTPSLKSDTVSFDKSVTLKVKAGRWKIGYEMSNGELRAMPPTLVEASEAQWPVANLVKGKEYRITIDTDEGNQTVWRHNIPLIAPDL